MMNGSGVESGSSYYSAQESLKDDQVKKGCCSTKKVSKQPKKETKDGCCSSKSREKTQEKKGCCSSKPSEKTVVSITVSPESTSLFMTIAGMTCAGCCTRIEQYLSQQEGIESLSISLLTHKAEVMYDASKISVEEILDHIKRIGFTATPMLDTRACSVTFELRQVVDTGAVQSFITSQSGVCGISTGRQAADVHQMVVMYDPEVIGSRTLLQKLQDAFGVSHVAVVPGDAAAAEDETHKHLKDLKNRFLVSCALTFPVAMIHFVLPLLFSATLDSFFQSQVVKGLSWSDFIGCIAATPVQLYVARPIYESGYAALRYSKRANMDLLISLSTTTAYIVSIVDVISSMLSLDQVRFVPLQPQTFFEVSTMLVTLILLGRLTEQKAKTKTLDSVRALLNLQVKTAILVESGGENVPVETYIDMELVQRGDFLKVLPGARVPTDGVVIEGHSKVDESMVTGESIAMTKEPGTQLIGGTVNQNGVLIMEATRAVHETLLSQIVRLVESAQSSKPETQRIADIVASYFTTAIIILATSMFFLWYFLASTGSVYYDVDHTTPFAFALRFAITVLVISCPCAISLAVPTAVMVATGVGARMGVLFKGGHVLELLKDIDAVVFDKTGTLTVGSPQVVNMTLLSSNGTYEMKDRQRFWEYVASAESSSEHPIGKSIKDHVLRLGHQLRPTSDFVSDVGSGISCLVEGHEVAIGKLCWLQHRGVHMPKEYSKTYESMQSSGCSVVCAAIDGNLEGIIALQDAPRLEARQVVQRLRAMDIQVWMMTGDQAGTAKSIAKQVDIPETCVVAGVLPDVKVEKVGVLQSLGKRVAFVGDGVNDAPALASADLGIAVGAGTDVALQTADLILVKDDLRDLLNAMALSRVTAQRIRYNFLWGFVYNLIMMPIASGALYALFRITIPPAFCGLSELVSSVPVIILSLLLNFWKPPYVETMSVAMNSVDEFMTEEKKSLYGSFLSKASDNSQEKLPLLKN